MSEQALAREPKPTANRRPRDLEDRPDLRRRHLLPVEQLEHHLIAQRQPIVLAKELAAIDVLSKGRLLFGLGVGYVLFGA